MDIPIEPAQVARSLLPGRRKRLAGPIGILVLALTLTPATLADDSNSGVGKSYRVPYRLTDTNHFLVRLRINGKGPFNFLVDTGAPAFFIATETAKKAGLTPAKDSFWTRVERIDFEGGAKLTGLRARVEDPFQLVGMNALGLPGASIDGLIGYTVLARFRIELDPTKDRMVWTRLDFNPVDPPIPHRPNGGAPLEMQAMNALGPLAKGLAFIMGKQAEDQLQPRGFLGVEWSETKAEGNNGTGTSPRLRIDRVLSGSPAEKAGLQSGDLIVKLRGKAVAKPADARAALADLRSGDPVSLAVRRGQGTEANELIVTVTAGEGL